MTSLKSKGYELLFSNNFSLPIDVGIIFFFLLIYSITSCKFLAPITVSPETTPASFALASGSIIFLIPSLLASIHIGRIPLTLLSLPSRESSPTKIVSLSSFVRFNSPEHIKIPTAIGRSKKDPSFFISAGAKLTTIFLL